MIVFLKVEKIMTLLKEESYEVWSSVDFADSCGDFDFLCDDSHSQSPVFDAYSHEKAYSSDSLINKLNHCSFPDSKSKWTVNVCFFYFCHKIGFI